MKKQTSPHVAGLLCILAASVSTSAIAQPSAVSDSDSPPSSAPGVVGVGAEPIVPRFLIVDRANGSSLLAADLAVVFFSGDEAPDVTAVRLDLNGAYMVTPAAGFTWSLPISYANGDGDSESAIGGIALGGEFIHRLAPNSAVVFQAALNLPTAGDGFTDAFVNSLAGFSRITDVHLTLPEAFTASAGASFMGSVPLVAYRLDFGLVAPLENDTALDKELLIRVNGAVAVGTGPVRFMAELANLGITDDLGDGGSWINQAGIGATGTSGQFVFAGGIYTILDQLDNDVVPVSVNFTVGARLGH